MIRYQLRFIFRNLIRNKSSFFINLVGLSAGFTCAILILLWVTDELSVDKFHQNDKNLYQVMENHQMPEGITTQAWTPDLLARTLAGERSDIQYASAVMPSIHFEKFNIFTADNKQVKASGQFAEPDFFHIFSYPLLEGNQGQVLKETNSIVISEKMALSLFNTTENVIGKTVEWEILNSRKQAVISGIFKDIPANSTTHFDFVLSFDCWLNLSESVGRKIHWGNHAPYTYLVLNPGADIKKLDTHVADFLKSKNGQSNISLFTIPYSSQYLHGNFTNGKQAGGRIEYVRLFSIIAIFILLIAGINFINLATARATRRVKEVGIRKVSGSSRKALAVQFTFEAMVIVMLAMLLSIMLTSVLLPQFNQLTGKELQLFLNPDLMLKILGICLITGILTSLYPAIYLSGFSPSLVLKGKMTASIGELWARKGLVVFQFGISVVLIASMMVIYQQIQFIRNTNMGYEKDHVIYFAKEGNVAQKQEAFLTEIRNIPGVVNASAINGELTGTAISTYDLNWAGKDAESKVNFDMTHADAGLVETLGIEMADGRSFSSQYGDEKNNVILNQQAIDMMGLKNPVGQSIRLWGEEKQIIGVAKNFHFKSLRHKINPMIITYMPQKTVCIMAKLEAGTEAKTLASIKKLYTTFNTGSAFEYQFLDTAFQKLYAAEERVSVLSKYFAGLGILISCLGLFGLATYASEQRIKEIGVRKVNGATIWEIITLLNNDFVKWVAISFIIATPISYYAMTNWLENFAYKTDLSWWIFALAGLLALGIALLTVSWQSWKAATRNPVEALRYE
ncbi:MAG: ABC transporter permease [Verrucomicrobia bacterium]|nr:ABC transporter permease [Prolixibacteraceae bacterium]